AAASALIGHARWARATPGWREPPHLWLASVGDSGSAKSPGADVLLRDVLPEIERRMGGDFPERLRAWQAGTEARKAGMEAWAQDVRAARKSGHAPPLPPPDGDPPEPQQPRIHVSDVTVERVATLLAGAAPGGLLVVRDEIAGWLLGMNTYNDVGRAFWIEAYGGRPYRVERQKHPEPIHVERLAVAVAGGIQPEKLAELFRDGDDGLLSRFIWCWPRMVPFRLSRAAPGVAWAIGALDRLRRLEPGMDVAGNAVPLDVPLAEGAVAAMEQFGRAMQRRQVEAGGLMRSAYGKARGLALRLSLVLAMLRWCAGEGPEPREIGEAVFNAACALVADYAMPMAARVFGDAAVPKRERDAATLARWILSTRAPEVHVRRLQKEIRLPGLSSAEDIHLACWTLVEAGWLCETPASGAVGRPKTTYLVNPTLPARAA
ncbi:MAG: DUF3987 domain-containing protein, partial [Rhodospirillales bacterium]|nr:DUF3987 domain-containing protein [Rhodospirillales bacterium]